MIVNDIKVLIVDDDELTRLLHRKIIGSVTFQPTSEARNGLDALELVVNQYSKDKTLPDFILLDTEPIISSLAFIEALQNLNFLKEISIIIITAVDDDYDDKLKYVLLGVKYFFIKPIRITLLKNAILETIGQLSGD